MRGEISGADLRGGLLEILSLRQEGLVQPRTQLTMKRVHALRQQRRRESDERFQKMIARLEAHWRKQLGIKSPAHLTREAGAQTNTNSQQNQNENP